MPSVVFRAGPAAVALLLPLLGCGPFAGTSASPAPSAASTTPITAADLRTRLYAYADDSMQGRRSGTPGNVKATDYIAAEAKRIGLEPAGENGGWFQTVPILQRTLDPTTGITVDGTTFKAWDDIIPRDQGTGARSIDGAQVIYGGTWDRDLISLDQARGKLVVITLPPVNGVPGGSANRAQTTERFNTAAGIVVATLDDIGTSERLDLQDFGAQLSTGHGPETPAFLYASSRLAEALLGAPLSTLKPGTEGRTASGTVAFVDTPVPNPARNVVAVLRGTDPALRGEYVAIGAHNDHDGISPETLDHDSLRAFNRLMRPEGANSTPGQPTVEQAAQIRSSLDSLRKVRKPRPDSVLNGADDDGSGTVAVLEIAEQLAKTPPKRSLLFVWHVAEEMGLLGSNYFTRNPTVPRDSIVAQLNIDMVGRGRRGRHRERRSGLPPDHRLAPALERARRPGGPDQRRGEVRLHLRLPVRCRRTPEQLLLPQRPLHVRAVRDSHRVLHDREPPRLSPADGRAAVHRLRQDGAGRAAGGGCGDAGGGPGSSDRGGQAEAGSGGGV